MTYHAAGCHPFSPRQVSLEQTRQLRDASAWLRYSAKWPEDVLPRCGALIRGPIYCRKARWNDMQPLCDMVAWLRDSADWPKESLTRVRMLFWNVFPTEVNRKRMAAVRRGRQAATIRKSARGVAAQECHCVSANTIGCSV